MIVEGLGMMPEFFFVLESESKKQSYKPSSFFDVNAKNDFFFPTFENYFSFKISNFLRKSYKLSILCESRREKARVWWDMAIMKDMRPCEMSIPWHVFRREVS